MLLNTRSLTKHVHVIANDQRLLNNDFICFTETQIKHGQTVDEISEILKQFSMYFNNNQNHFLSIAYGHSESISILDHEHHPALSVVTVLKKSFVESPFIILLLYRKISQPLETFFDYLQYFLEANTVHFVVGDFNIDALTGNPRLQTILSSYTQVVNEPTHQSGSLLDHIYVKNTIFEKFSISTSTINIYFSDHDAVRLKVTSQDVDFNIVT